MGAGPYFDSGGFRRDQVNSVGVHLVDVDGNPYTAAGGSGSSVVDSQMQFREGAAWVNAPGTAARGLLVDPISGGTDGQVGLPARIGAVGGYDGTNLRALKTDSDGVLQVDVLTSPAGASTLAEQQTQTTRLTEIRDRLPDLTATAAPAATDEGLVVHVATQPAGGGAAGTEYTEAAVDATITGTAIMWEDTGDTLRAVSAVKPLPVSGPLTDTQLRATPVPVSGTVTASGPLTDAQLRASAVPVDSELTTADLDTGAGTDTRAVIGLARAESGGALLVGSANPLPVVLDATSLAALETTELGATTLAALESITVVDGGGSLTVDGSVSLAAAIPAGTNNIGDVDVLTLPALPAGTNNIGDVDVLTLPAISLAASTNNIGDVDVLTLPGVAGTVAHDAADSGNPLKVGARALTADITAVAANDRVDALATSLGKGLVHPYALPANLTNGDVTTLTGTTAGDVIAAPGAGIRLYITEITVTNHHATVGTKVEIRDGTTVMRQISAQAVGGGASMTFPAPLRLTANTALTARCVTTGADVDVSASGYTAAE